MRRITVGIGAFVLVSAVAVGGAMLWTWWVFGDKVDPAYLDALQADPMAAYQAPGLVLESRREVEAADTWKRNRSAEIVQEYSISPSEEPAEAMQRLVATAERLGWERIETVSQDSTLLHRNGRRMAVSVSSGEEAMLYLTLTYP